jgi:hypothetical protein
MNKFLQTLFGTPVKASLTAWLGAVVGIVVLQFAGPSGDVTLPAKTATELLLLTGALILSVGAVAYSYWKKCQPIEMVDRAIKQGRPICHCTEAGTVMIVPDTNPKGGGIKSYKCPKCGDIAWAQRPMKQV